MAWYLYIRESDGTLLSVGDRDADAPPPGVIRVSVASDPRDPALMYAPATRTLVARPAKVVADRLQDVLSDPRFAEFATVWNSLSAANKTRLRNALILLLGRQRYRSAGESVEVP